MRAAAVPHAVDELVLQTPRGVWWYRPQCLRHDCVRALLETMLCARLSVQALTWLRSRLDPGTTASITFDHAAQALAAVGVYAEVLRQVDLLDLLEDQGLTVLGIDGATLYGAGRPREHSVAIAGFPELECGEVTVDVVDPSPLVQPLLRVAVPVLEAAYRATDRQALWIPHP